MVVGDPDGLFPSPSGKAPEIPAAGDKNLPDPVRLGARAGQVDGALPGAGSPTTMPSREGAAGPRPALWHSIRADAACEKATERIAGSPPTGPAACHG